MLLHYEETGQGPPVVLLHGMAGSLRYWDQVVPYLAKTHRVITVDLLGFGHSPMPKDVTYNIDTHLKSIMETFEHLKVNEPFTLVGHSMGALLALKLALAQPKKVQKLALISMPVWNKPQEARQAITGGRLSRRLAYYGPTSHTLCTVWCKFLRPVSSRLAHLYIKNQPVPVTRESVLHTWQSYDQSMRYVIENQQVEADLQQLITPTLLLYGDKEDTLTLRNIDAFKSLPDNVRGENIEGSHNLPIESPQFIARKIDEA